MQDAADARVAAVEAAAASAAAAAKEAALAWKAQLTEAQSAAQAARGDAKLADARSMQAADEKAAAKVRCNAVLCSAMWCTQASPQPLLQLLVLSVVWQSGRCNLQPFVAFASITHPLPPVQLPMMHTSDFGGRAASCVSWGGEKNICGGILCVAKLQGMGQTTSVLPAVMALPSGRAGVKYITPASLPMSAGPFGHPQPHPPAACARLDWSVLSRAELAEAVARSEALEQELFNSTGAMSQLKMKDAMGRMEKELGEVNAVRHEHGCGQEYERMGGRRGEGGG
eukprot:365381-Chlamydomonas_euryale.AAC.34